MSHDNAPRTRFTDDQLNALKDRNPVHSVAGDWVKLRRKSKGKFIGPCPLCSDDPQKKSSTRFECDADKWVCAVCHKGGDVIGLLQAREGIDFVAAVERLGGIREEVPTPALAEKAGRIDYRRWSTKPALPPTTPAQYAEPALRAAYAAGWAKGKKADDYAEFARNRERTRLYGFWKAGARFAGTPVEAYLARRGYVVPPNARLRFHPSMPLFADGSEVEPVLAHRGPAMLAAIINAEGKFSGLHITWLDPAGPKGKALVLDPHTGEVLPSKKSRGSKAGGYIDLGGFPVLMRTIAPSAEFVGPCGRVSYVRMFAGEGIETVLAVYTALHHAGKVRLGDGFRSGIDLGNLAGGALETLAHPTAKTETGRARRVPGPDPDRAALAMPVPDAVSELVLLGDGDSDPFTTRNALERSRRRNELPGRIVRVAFAPDGTDFDDMLNRSAAPSEAMQEALTHE